MSVIFLSSCKIDVNEILNTDNDIFVSIHENGKNTIKYKLEKGSSNYQLLSTWANENTKGWTPTPVTYINGVVVDSKEFSLNFLSESVILNSKDGQHSKSVKKSDYQFLLNVPHNQSINNAPLAPDAAMQRRL